MCLEWIVVIDFSIAPESAVASYPVPQDSMLNQYAIQSVYNQSNPQCIIKQECDQQQQQQQTPSTISTASTISTKQEEPIIKMTLIPTTIPSLPTQYPIPTQTMTVQPMIAQPNTTNIYNNTMWHENDYGYSKTETIIFNKNKQNNNRIKTINNKLYESETNGNSSNNSIEYCGELYTN